MFRFSLSPFEVRAAQSRPRLLTAYQIDAKIPPSTLPARPRRGRGRRDEGRRQTRRRGTCRRREQRRGGGRPARGPAPPPAQAESDVNRAGSGTGGERPRYLCSRPQSGALPAGACGSKGSVYVKKRVSPLHPNKRKTQWGGAGAQGRRSSQPRPSPRPAQPRTPAVSPPPRLGPQITHRTNERRRREGGTALSQPLQASASPGPVPAARKQPLPPTPPRPNPHAPACQRTMGAAVADAGGRRGVVRGAAFSLTPNRPGSAIAAPEHSHGEPHCRLLLPCAGHSPGVRQAPRSGQKERSSRSRDRPRSEARPAGHAAEGSASSGCCLCWCKAPQGEEGPQQLRGCKQKVT